MPKVPRLGCVEFGHRLIETRDLDPVYVLLWECDQLRNNRETMQLYLLAYWCFYDMGTAAWIVDGGEYSRYWERMCIAAASKEYPRGRERRHYRGKASVLSMNYLEAAGLENLYESLYKCSTCPEVMKEVMLWRGFGPWIAFKAADMLERLGLAEIEFNPEHVSIFDSPRKGAEELRESLSADVEPSGVVRFALDYLIDQYQGTSAPPRNERFVNAQEAETVLCKWHAYNTNKYHIGEDIASCHKCLTRFQSVPLARKLLQAGRASNLWK